MPTSSTPGDRASRDAIVATILASDPEMQAMARQFVMEGLREMIHQLKRGDAATRAAIAKSVSGAVTSLFTQQSGDDGLGELRTEMHEMVAEMRGEMGLGTDRDGAGERDAGVDAQDGPARDAELAERHRVMVPKS